jgi:hypothetical protein
MAIQDTHTTQIQTKSPTSRSSLHSPRPQPSLAFYDSASLWNRTIGTLCQPLITLGEAIASICEHWHSGDHPTRNKQQQKQQQATKSLNKDWKLPKSVPTHINRRVGFCFAWDYLNTRPSFSLELIEYWGKGLRGCIYFSQKRQKVWEDVKDMKKCQGRHVVSRVWHRGNPRSYVNLILLGESIPKIKKFLFTTPANRVSRDFGIKFAGLWVVEWTRQWQAIRISEFPDHCH